MSRLKRERGEPLTRLSMNDNERVFEAVKSITSVEIVGYRCAHVFVFFHTFLPSH